MRAALIGVACTVVLALGLSASAGNYEPPKYDPPDKPKYEPKPRPTPKPTPKPKPKPKVDCSKHFQAESMYDLSGKQDEGKSLGAAWIKRTCDKIEGHVTVKVDKAWEAYSVWWVIFNHPDKCTGGKCDADDAEAGWDSPSAPATIHASGAISAATGHREYVTVKKEVEIDPKREKYLEYLEKKYGRPMPRLKPPLMRMPVNAGVITVTFGLHAGQEGRGKPCCSGKLYHDNAKGAEIHIVVSQGSHKDGWVKALTTPGEEHRYAVFKKTRH